MHNAVMCTLSLYDVIGITRHLHIKLKSFSNIAKPLHKEAVRGCSFLYIIAKKSVIMSEAFLVDVSIYRPVKSTLTSKIYSSTPTGWYFERFVFVWFEVLHTFVEIDHEIISTAILLPSTDFKKGCCQLQAKVCARSIG